MKKLHFENDYMAGAHPLVLEELCRTNMDETVGYGADPYSQEARSLILGLCGLEANEAEVHFFIGGTQTNATVIDGLLGKCEAVVSAESGHINVHEAGAIEMNGHKVIELPQYGGKIGAGDLADYLDDFYGDDTWPHMSIPGMVYITHPTEIGTLYTLSELKALHQICQKYSLPLYLDGARLGYGLGTRENDVSMKDIAKYCDAFYIGGNKCGALFGEALVIKKGLVRNMFTLMKAHGAVLAKGRLLGVQFQALMRDNLYQRIGALAVKRAQELRKVLTKAGFIEAVKSPTNQLFFEMPNEIIETLMHEVGFQYWGPKGEETSIVRFVTSWFTTKADIVQFKKILASIQKT